MTNIERANAIEKKYGNSVRKYRKAVDVYFDKYGEIGSGRWFPFKAILSSRMYVTTLKEFRKNPCDFWAAELIKVFNEFVNAMEKVEV